MAFFYFQYGLKSSQSTSELLGLLTGLGLLKLWYLIYPGHLTGCGMLVFFINCEGVHLIKKLNSKLLFVVLFLGIISWKGASCFNGGASFYPSTFVYTCSFP